MEECTKIALLAVVTSIVNLSNSILYITNYWLQMTSDKVFLDNYSLGITICISLMSHRLSWKWYSARLSKRVRTADCVQWVI